MPQVCEAVTQGAATIPTTGIAIMPDDVTFRKIFNFYNTHKNVKGEWLRVNG